MTDAVLTIQDVAVILKLAETTVDAMPNESELAALRVRRQWRIRKVDLDTSTEVQAKATANTPPRKGE